jgi:1-acylglycerone phosphate reductase
MPKSVLITGCSAGGIGYELANSFHKRGLIVFATARNLSTMTALQELSNVHLLLLDVTSSASIASALEEVKRKTGSRLDFLVNNAGRGYTMPVLDSNIDEAKRLFDANFWGPLQMIQAFAPLLKEARGVIINIGSIVAYMNVPWSGKMMVPLVCEDYVMTHPGLYSASKSALHMLTDVLRLELAPLNISTLIVVTGSIATNFHAAGRMPDGSLPPGSYYLPAEKHIKARAVGDDNIPRSSSKDFAEGVVNDVLNSKSGRTWQGRHATLVRVGSALFPTSLMVSDVLIKVLPALIWLIGSYVARWHWPA